ncbi:MAG: hypothetical protein AABW79_03460 [Nanoarchaeota archaeon]
MEFQTVLCRKSIEGTVQSSSVVTGETELTQIQLCGRKEIFLYKGNARVDALERVRFYSNNEPALGSIVREICAMQILTEKGDIKTTYAPVEMFR